MFFFYFFLFLFYFLIFKNFFKKLLILLCMEGLTLTLIFIFGSYFYSSGVVSFSMNLLLIIMMVLDSIFGLCLILNFVRKDSFLYFNFSNF